MATKIDLLHKALQKAIRAGNKAEQARIIIRLKEAHMQVKSHDTGKPNKLNRTAMERSGNYRVHSYRSVKMPLGFGGHYKNNR